MKVDRLNTLIANMALAACFIGIICGATPGQADSSARSDNSGSVKSRPVLIASDIATSSAKTLYQSWHDAKRNRDIPIKVYVPTGSTATRHPVVIFSHGLGDSREAAVYLGEYWAAHGYMGIFVQHPGSDTAVWQPTAGQGRQMFLEKMKAAANGENLVERIGDIKFVLNELEKRNQSDPDLKNTMDLSKIAVAGHSFGAGTALAIAGQGFRGQNSGGDDRVKAAIYLCPPVMLGEDTPQHVFGSIKIPGMLLTGTEDNSPIGKTTAEQRRIPFDGMKAPHQYLINFVGADHAVFGGRAFRAPKPEDEKIHEMVDELTTKFLDATLKNDAGAWKWLDSGAASAYLGKAAVFERK
jgi:predicted dienelactone hydrolase